MAGFTDATMTVSSAYCYKQGLFSNGVFKYTTTLWGMKPIY